MNYNCIIKNTYDIGNSSSILKVSDKNIEKWKSFLVRSILRLSQTEIWTILLIFGSFLALVFIFQLILSYWLQGICSLGNLVKELRTVTGRLPVGYRSLNGRLPVG